MGPGDRREMAIGLTPAADSSGESLRPGLRRPEYTDGAAAAGDRLSARQLAAARVVDSAVSDGQPPDNAATVGRAASMAARAVLNGMCMYTA